MSECNRKISGWHLLAHKGSSYIVSITHLTIQYTEGSREANRAALQPDTARVTGSNLTPAPNAELACFMWVLCGYYVGTICSRVNGYPKLTIVRYCECLYFLRKLPACTG